MVIMTRKIERRIERSMISPSSLLRKTGGSLPENVSWDQAGRFGLASYEAGMMEVLRGIAEEELDYGGIVSLSSQTEKLQKETVEKYEVLEKALTGIEHEMLRDYEDAMQDSANSDAADHFIQGFIRGYRYLKNQMEFRGGCR